MNQKTKILMVCLGNICRSPLAEGILKSKLDPQKFEVDSAGTGNWHVGEKPDHRSIEIAKNHQINLNNQRARHFNVKDFNEFDLIFVMDDKNYEDVLNLAPDSKSKNKVHKIVSFDEQNNKEIPDPYYGNLSDFENVFQMLDRICNILANQLISKNFAQ